MSSINGCSSTSIASAVIVNALPVATVLLNGAATFCQGNSVIINANVGAGLTYQWQNNGANILGATGANYTATSSGSYAVLVSNVNGCSSASATTIVSVNSLPNVTLGAFNQVCDTLGLLQLTGGSPVGGSFSGTSVISNSFNTNIGVGVYPIIYSYTDINGCSASDTENIQVINCPTAGINEQVTSSIYIYPNPVVDEVQLSGLFHKNEGYNVTDLSGRTFLTGLADEKINVSTLPSGSYFIRVGATIMKFIKL